MGSKEYEIRQLLRPGIMLREVQSDIISALGQVASNCLVVLPAASGKTLIAAAMMASESSHGKTVLLAPTVPLVNQHLKYVSSVVKEKSIAAVTGKVPMHKREAVYSAANVIIATPESLRNDIISGTFDIRKAALVIIDECHRAVGNYAYVDIANFCRAAGTRIIGMTATPGSSKEVVSGLLNTISADTVMAISKSDPRLSSQAQDRVVNTVTIPRDPRITDISKHMRTLAYKKLCGLDESGIAYANKLCAMIFYGRSASLSQVEKHRLGVEIENVYKNRERLCMRTVSDSDPGSAANAEAALRRIRGERFASIRKYVMLLHAMHCYDLIETQGLAPFLEYLKEKRESHKKSLSLSEFLKDSHVAAASTMATQMLEAGCEHPKYQHLTSIINENPRDSIIVFCDYRSTASNIASRLNSLGIPSSVFMGERTSKGLARNIDSLNAFSEKRIRVLISTSIGEEGTDIPVADTVVCFSPPPMAGRKGQQEGRVGRVKPGKVFILKSEGTRDDKYFAASKWGQVHMEKVIREIKDITRHLGDKPRYEQLSLWKEG